MTVGAPGSLPAVGVPFAGGLRTHGSRLAVAGAQGSLTYDELADRVDALRARLGVARKLVLLTAANDVDTLVTYLAALAGGHPVLLTSADAVAGLAQTYDPDVVAEGGQLDVRRAESAHDLHPDLALLLSTSGSTGSRKLVRLSAENLQSNAAAIAGYLDIRPDDRAPTSLPMQYCYGLSVIHSNLFAGAGLLLTDASVVDRRFWELMREHGGTSVHGVPYTFDLLKRRGFTDLELPSLRYVTQAGGRLAPETVQELAGLGSWRLYVMYGQTEATARMAYLDPSLASTRPNAVGRPIPGGEFMIAGGGDEGELLYRGPNVMLGYATSPADLAAGRTIDALATGDLAQRAPDGLWEITGRASRFVKICGVRVDLDALEHRLTADGRNVACAGDDERLVVAVETAGGLEGTARRLAQRLGLPPDRVHVVATPRLPRTDRGKIDYPALASLSPQPDPPRPTETVRDIYARVLHLDPAFVRDEDTFVSLGGDSLHYVGAAVRLERLLGDPPASWPTTPVAELQKLRPRPSAFAMTETPIALRAAAIVLVVGTHLGLWTILGGAHVLLVLAGWSFGRFCVPATSPGDEPSRRILRAAARIAIPGVLWIAWRTTSQWDTGLPNTLLFSGYAGKPWTIAYWFIEVLVHMLLALSLLYAVPAVRRLDVRHRLALPLTVFGVGVALRLVGMHPPGAVPWWLTHQVVWVFALGWLTQRCRTRFERLAVLALGVAMLLGLFDVSWRTLLVACALAAVLFVPRLPVPRLLVGPVGLIAGASLYIYLTHYAWVPQLTEAVGAPLATVIAVGTGVAAGLVVETGSRGARELWRTRRRAGSASEQSSPAEPKEPAVR